MPLKTLTWAGFSSSENAVTSFYLDNFASGLEVLVPDRLVELARRFPGETQTLTEARPLLRHAALEALRRAGAARRGPPASPCVASHQTRFNP